MAAWGGEGVWGGGDSVCADCWDESESTPLRTVGTSRNPPCMTRGLMLTNVYF